MGRWRGYSEEERQARRLADRQHRERANHWLDDPHKRARIDLQRELADEDDESRLPDYSTRNLAMLLSQADVRGMTVTDADDVRGWRMRGRRVIAGARGFRVAADEDTDEPPRRFEPGAWCRMVSVFDVTQTVPLDTAAGTVDGGRGEGVAA